MPAVPRGGDAVEQVHAARDPLEQIGGKADSHKITGDLARQARLERLQHAMHHRLGLADREPADGDAGPGAAREGALERAEPEVVVGAALDDGPEGLAASDGERSATPSCASCRSMPRSSAPHPATASVRSIPSLGELVRRLAGHDVVERHGDVGAEGPLDLHGALGGERALGAVHVALELDAVLRDAAEPLEREDLEAAASR